MIDKVNSSGVTHINFSGSQFEMLIKRKFVSLH